MKFSKKHVWKAMSMILILAVMMSMTVFAADAEAAYEPAMYILSGK